MKVAILSESPADEAALRFLIDGLLRTQTEPVNTPPLRTRGWPAVRIVLPTVLKHLQFNTDAEGVVVVVDSNGTTVHDQLHPVPENAPQDCRVCQLWTAVNRIRSSIPAAPGCSPVKVAIGLAVPTIEAWYLCGSESGIDEKSWINRSHGLNVREHTLELKRKAYGSHRAPLSTMISVAREQSARLANDLSSLQTAFPNGFGSLVRDLQGW